MPVLSFSVQSAGERAAEQSPITNTILKDCLRQREGDTLSLAILGSKHISCEADHNGMKPKGHFEDDVLKVRNYVMLRHMDESPDDGEVHAERPLLNGECSQSRNSHELNDEILETDDPLMSNCNALDGTSVSRTSFSGEKHGKEEDCSFSNLYLQCNGNGNCHGQKGAELVETTCSTSGYDLHDKDSCSNVMSEDKKRVASNCEASTSSKMQDSRGRDTGPLFPSKDNCINIRSEDRNGVASNCEAFTLTEGHDFHGEGEVLHGAILKPMSHTFQTELQQQSSGLLSDSMNSLQTTEHIENQAQVHNQEEESGPSGADYVEDQTMALWVKWRGKWQTGFQCPRVDCPLQTLRAKPTHERKKYIAIFFPRARRYSWADLLLIRSINEFPEPLVSGTHRKWRKWVKDLTTPRRFVMQKLAVAMLNISDQLHTEAVVEVARKATTWKEFAMEASQCRDYSDLGMMLLKLQIMILPSYVSNAWLETSFGPWKQRCQNANSAESVEILTKELMASVQWSKVDDLWNAPIQPELSPEWKAWKQEAMRWFSTSHPIANVANVSQGNCASVSKEPQNSSKRPKLEVRRAESCASQAEASDCRILSQIIRVDTDSGHSICQGIIESTPRCEPCKIQEHSEDMPMNSGIITNSRWNEIPENGGYVKLIENPVQRSIDGRRGNAARVPYQYRQCAAFIAAKGRQCGRWASDGDTYCCVHTNASSGGKSLQDQRPPPDAPMCKGTTTHGQKCKHRARLGSTFCKKHCLQSDHDSVETNSLLANHVSALSKCNLKRKIVHDHALEKFSSSNASNSKELGLIEYGTSMQENLIPVAIGGTLDTRNCSMKESALHNASPSLVRAASPDFPHCIGFYGQANSEQCLENANKHTLYCDKHIPNFLKRARNGKTRLVSKDAFTSLLKNCSSRNQKLYLHQACDLLYGFMKRSLSSQKQILKGNIMDWTLSQASKDLNVGEYLLKLVSVEREKITRLWGSEADTGKMAISPGAIALPAMEIHDKDYGPETTLKCKICGVEFADDQMLAAHWTDSHKKEARWLFRGYACAVCMSSFTNRKVLESHVIERHGPQFLEHSILFRCMSCDSPFASPEQLRQHVLSFHLTELRMADSDQQNYHSMDQLCQSKVEFTKEDGPQRFICRFCGMKFDLLPDLGRHHQVAHKNQNSINQLRGNHYIKHNRHSHPRFKKNFGAAFRFKNQTSFSVQKRFPSSNLFFSRRPKLKGQASETLAIGRLLESHCAEVAETLFSEMQKAKPRPSNTEILSIARSACCRISLHAALEAKYGRMPENLYLKAAKLCSEQNIQISWHVEGFICLKGCKPFVMAHPLTSLKSVHKGAFDPLDSHTDFVNDTKWEMEECHYILDSKHFDWEAAQKAIILCEDVTFGKEPVPVPCVIDKDLKDVLNISYHGISYSERHPGLVPWQEFTYVTRRLIEPSLSHHAENSHLGCACPPSKCSPEKCDHVYLFDNDYENAEDIHGNSMRGRFPYDEKGRIVLEQGHLVYECNSLCKCDATCHNRVLQKGIQVKLEIFKTENKGWAVRAGEAIVRGTFVCEYIGEVINDADGNKRGERFNNAGCNYIYDINAHVGPQCLNEGTVSYVVDATNFGNVSRFINHSCLPNLANYLVLVESMDCQLAHIGLYASRDIACGEELCYDYCHELLAEGGCPCHCGAPNCRGRLY